MWFRRKKMTPVRWREEGRPRVLLENADGESSFVALSALREAGYDVALCPGPIQPGLRPERCPLLDPDEGCPLVDGADVVVTSLDLERPETRDVVIELRALRPWKPLVIEVTPDDARRYPELIEGQDVVVSPTQPGQLVAKVEQVLAKA